VSEKVGFVQSMRRLEPNKEKFSLKETYCHNNLRNVEYKSIKPINMRYATHFSIFFLKTHSRTFCKEHDNYESIFILKPFSRKNINRGIL